MPAARTTIPLLPLGCGGSGRTLIERALLAVPGVLKAYVNPVTEMAYVEYDPTQCAQTQIRAAVARTGFGLSEPALEPAPRARRGGTRPQTRGFALTAGILFAGAFALSTLPPLLAPPLRDGQRWLWTVLLPGLDLSRWLSFPIGLAVTFAYGLAGGWLIAALYGMLNRRPSQSGLAHPAAASPNAPRRRDAPSGPGRSK